MRSAATRPAPRAEHGPVAFGRRVGHNRALRASGQRVERQTDGGVVVSFTTAALFEIERQVLRHGGRVEVLEPTSLRASVGATAAAIVATHR